MLYADDVVLYTSIYSQEACHNLQQDLDLFKEWETKWKMPFNLQKYEPVFTQYLTQNEIINAKYTQLNNLIRTT